MKNYLQKLLGNLFINELFSTNEVKNTVNEIGIVINENTIKLIVNTAPEYHDNILKIEKFIFDKKHLDKYFLLDAKYGVARELRFVNENFSPEEIKKFTYYYFVPAKTINRYIFKYHSANKFLEKLIENNTLWFNSPDNFKDITDCKFEIDTEPSKKNILGFYYNRYIHELQKENNKLTIAEFEEGFELPSVSQFNSDLLDHQFKGTISKLGIACFSEKHDHKLMWDQYTNGYEGVCLIFDTEITGNDYYKFKGKKVRYFESPQRYFFDGTGHLEIGHIVYSKTTEYSFENEVREIVNFQFEKEIERNIKFNPLALKGVIFGPNCAASTKDKVKQLVSHPKYKNVELINSNIDYKLHFQLESTILDLKEKATANK